MQRCIDALASHMEGHHSNVRLLQPSGTRVRRDRCVEENVIICHVNRKGYIPLGEPMLPLGVAVDGHVYALDVRSGPGHHPHAHSSRAVMHVDSDARPVRIGDGIAALGVGTIGAGVEFHPDMTRFSTTCRLSNETMERWSEGKYDGRALALTCAHVVDGNGTNDAAVGDPSLLHVVTGGGNVVGTAIETMAIVDIPLAHEGSSRGQQHLMTTRKLYIDAALVRIKRERRPTADDSAYAAIAETPGVARHNRLYPRRVLEDPRLLNGTLPVCAGSVPLREAISPTPTERMIPYFKVGARTNLTAMRVLPAARLRDANEMHVVGANQRTTKESPFDTMLVLGDGSPLVDPCLYYTRCADEGDSGATIFDSRGRAGLLVGGGDRDTQHYAYATPMCVLESALHVRPCDVRTRRSTSTVPSPCM